MLVMLAVGAASMALRVAQLDAAPFVDWAEQSRHVDVEAVLTSDPELVDRASFGAADARQVRVELMVRKARSGGEAIALRTPVLAVGEGAGWEDLRLGDRVRLAGSLRPAPSTSPLAAYLFTDDAPEHLGDESLVLRGAESMRSGLRRAVVGLGADAQGLLPALVVGDTGALPSMLVADLRDSGLAHLTAVSGANVAIVVGAGLLLARWVRVRGYALVGIGLALVVWFVLLARPQPSVLRAAVMGSVALVGVAVAGRGQAVRALLASVMVLLLADPWLARSWGFALSVAATAGLVMLARRWSSALPPWLPDPVRDGVGVALAAQVATLPLVVALSGQVAVLSVVANLLAAPAVAPATVLGAAAAAASPVAPRVAGACAWLAQWPTEWIAVVAHRTASAPVATLPWPEGWAGGVSALALIGAAVSAILAARRRGWWRPRRLVVVATLSTALLVAYLLGPGRWPPPGWVLVACDVGQGDALAVRVAESSALVVDAGPDAALVDRCLDRLGVEHVPLLVLTHFHADHVAGVPGVLDGRDVGTVLVSPLRDPPEQVSEVARWTEELPVVEAAPGQRGSVGDATWRVLWPDPAPPTEGSPPNNASVVLLVEVDGVRMLLTGDVEPPAQAALVAAGRVLQVDLLKVPHHGSRFQDEEFLAATSARVAVVSAGEDNPYGHPAPELLDALAGSGMLVARTDTEGTVAVVAGDDGLRVQVLP
jgi:competence protein ComEC